MRVIPDCHAALVTARAGRATLVLDTAEPGAGCARVTAARSAGVSNSALRRSPAATAALHAHALRGEDLRAQEWLATFVAEEGIDCDYRLCGRFHGAHSPRAFRRLVEATRNQPPRLELGSEIVSRTEQHRELGTEVYHGGVVHLRYGALDPARYHDGLLLRARAAQR